VQSTAIFAPRSTKIKVIQLCNHCGRTLEGSWIDLLAALGLAKTSKVEYNVSSLIHFEIGLDLAKIEANSGGKK